MTFQLNLEDRFNEGICRVRFGFWQNSADCYEDLWTAGICSQW